MSDWIQTYSGNAFYPTDPKPEDVRIEDIAHALSLICRYTGHVKEFYSVAQHSVIASMYCKDKMWALMHDAAEAYLADIARPIKHEMKKFVECENKLMDVIAVKFGLSLPMPEEVHVIDRILLATEKRDLMSPSKLIWSAIDGVEPLDKSIIPWTPERAEAEFMERFNELS